MSDILILFGNNKEKKDFFIEKHTKDKVINKLIDINGLWYICNNNFKYYIEISKKFKNLHFLFNCNFLHELSHECVLNNKIIPCYTNEEFIIEDNHLNQIYDLYNIIYKKCKIYI